MTRRKIVPVTEGGTGLVTSGALGNILTSDGTNWTSAAPASQLPQGFTGSLTRRSFYIQPAVGMASLSSVITLGAGTVGLVVTPFGGVSPIGQIQQGYSVINLTTPAAADDRVYLYQGPSDVNKPIRRDLLPTIGYLVVPSTTANVRVAFGLADDNNPSDLLTSSTPGSTNSAETVAFMYDTAASNTTWRCITSNTTTQTNTNSLVTFTAGTAYRLYIDMLTAGSVKFYIDGSLVATHTTNIPAATTHLGVFEGINSLTASAATIYIGRVAGESN